MEHKVGRCVCVIGAGALGLVMIKNLLEQGLEVTALECNEYVGGLWHASATPEKVSALAGTRANTSKQTVRRALFV
jgi:dimethylaniline monooxygenase (N-oxide forming)